jgi:hypothetical protein
MYEKFNSGCFGLHCEQAVVEQRTTSVHQVRPTERRDAPDQVPMYWGKWYDDQI